MGGASGAGSARPGDLRFRVLELRRDPAGVHTERRMVDVGSGKVGDAWRSGEPVDVFVRLEVVSGGVRVTGSAEFGWEGSCRRCLEAADGTARSEFSELFVDDPDDWAATSLDDDEVHAIDGGWVDLAEVVRDSVLVGLPLAPLCRDDCEGPSPEDFPVGTPDEGAPEGAQAEPTEERLDPRWAKLSEVTFDDDPADEDDTTR